VLREREQTLRAGCSKTDPKIFAPPQMQIPFPGGAGRPTFILGRKERKKGMKERKE